jgi:AsmA protein
LFIFTINDQLQKVNRLLLRILKIFGIAILSILIIIFLIPYFFPDKVGNQIKKWTNQSIKGDLNFTKARLSFFTHFPSLTLTLYDVDLKGSAPFEKEELLSADRLGFGVNLEKLIFNHQVSINKIFLTKAYFHVLIDEKGEANYNIYKTDSSKKISTNADSSSASLHLEQIIVRDSRLLYHDMSVPMLIQADHLYYQGTGDLSKSVFDLTSHIQTDSLSFTLGNKSYVAKKAIDANLITRVNTQTLALIFDNNRLKINKLNLAFNGKLNFLKNGYEMDFKLATDNADLYQFITAFPPEYLAWLKETTVKGTVSLESTLKGKYIVSTGEMPDCALKLNIRDGFISYKNVSLPVTGLKGYADIRLPSIDPEKLSMKLDSLEFHLDQDFFRAHFKTKGFSEPEIEGAADASMDLQNLKKATGISGVDMAGQLKLHLTTKGKYEKKVVQISLRKKDTVIARIPAFDLQCALRNGFIKYYKVAQPVKNIFLTMQASCRDSDYHHAFFKIDSLYAAALNDFIEGKAMLYASKDFPLEIRLKSSINLSDISQVYPMDSLSLSGQLTADLNCTGKYSPEHQLFPNTRASISLRNVSLQSKYYPHPLKNINIEANASDSRGDLKSLCLTIKPASFWFEDKPFNFEGSFKNFDDLNYNLSVSGELDLGKIYQVFAIKDIGLTGFIKANASFKGKQSDAMNQRFDLLYNSGSMEFRNLVITTEMFPKPFTISQGLFRFTQNKMWFDTFRAEYGSSDLQVNGFAENAINFVLSAKQPLKANFNLKSKTLDLNEFSFFANPTPDSKQNASVSGVILIPTNLDLTLKVEADKVLYSDISLNNFEGGILIDSGGIDLTETGFELIGCQVSMTGRYKPVSPLLANFSYHLQPKDFDVQRAYREIKLFHDLASSAAHASGIISLDYSLSGKLNEKMYPIYPSLVGGGVLSVKQVKFNGWKLFNTVSSQSGKTDLKDPDLSKIDIKSSIRNNLITIQKIKFKIGSLRVRLEGQTSFDNKINFKMRIGLPPLGIIGIPIRVSGTTDNPIIKMSASDNDPLTEEKDQ